ncbi:hypothetical protein PAPHI01_1781 [Pancytospora philotis]|nr:hypothetical protein PAPHI01_1781 [Pancytospora philotis]
MQTRSFKALRLLASSLSIAMILATAVFWGYCVWNIRFLQIEAEAMKESLLSFQTVAKTAGFFALLTGALTCYVMNIASKFGMLLDGYVSAVFLVLHVYFGYFVYFELRSNFAAILESEFYSRTQLNMRIRNWRPDVQVAKLRDLCKGVMNGMAGVFSIYALLCIGCSGVIVLLLLLARRMDLEKEDPVEDVPEITNSNKTGLCTISLRAKHVVRSAGP